MHDGLVHFRTRPVHTSAATVTAGRKKAQWPPERPRGRSRIDHHSPVPKYSQLREILLDLVETELDDDQSIPSERELSPGSGCPG